MNDGITEDAPAKINLSLHVTGRRDDGYHLLDSLVVFTEAGDRITARAAQSDSLSIDGPFAASLQSESDNLVLRARDLLREIAGLTPPVDIILEKNLPVASGIGGGSSDAAATLRALARLWDVAIDDAELAKRALTLGADLPMCLARKTLVARGIGEELTPTDSLPALSLVLVNPGIAVATPVVFAALANRENPPLPPLPTQPDLARFITWLKTTRNDLQSPALSVAPAIAEVLDRLSEADAVLARMSGSGATCFGIFASDDAAAKAAQALAEARPSWYVKATRTLRRVPAHVTS